MNAAEYVNKINEIQHQFTAAVAEPVVPEWTTPAHEEIDLATLKPNDLGLDPLFNEADSRFIDAIAAAKAKNAPIAADLIPAFPVELKQKKRWIVRTTNKLPYSANGHLGVIDPHDEQYQSSFSEAMKALQSNQFAGAGFVFKYDDGYTGIDFDGCVEAGVIRADVREVIGKLNTYCEFSPSGTGIHAIVKGWQFPIGTEGQQGAKVGRAEMYSGKRYFTTTGNQVPGTPSTVNERDVQWLYKRIVLNREFAPVKSTNPKAATADTGESTQISYAPGVNFKTDKYAIFMNGTITRDNGFNITNGVGTLTYPSQSEADLGFATVLALVHDGDTDEMDADFRKSPMYREKWERDDYRERTFRMALETATKIKEKGPRGEFQQTVPSVAATTKEVADKAEDASKDAKGTSPNGDQIPAFDDSVITGVFREIVDFVTAGTTIPRQFPFLAAKVYVGSRMAGSMKFEGVQDDPTMYGSVIGESGTSKGLSWERTIYKTLMPDGLLKRPVKVFFSFDSGAGLRDVFFDPPKELPVIGYIDEVSSLGRKAGDKKNPEIVDTIGELANSHRVSRTKAKRSKKDTAMSHDGAYLSMYMCGQHGRIFMASFPGRTELGFWDRFYPEFSEQIEPGDLPSLEPRDALHLLTRVEKFPFIGSMTMGEGVKSRLTKFWSELPKDVRVKVRWKSHLMLDMYFSAWSQGRMVATMEDLNVAIRIFQRQVIIRKVHFAGEIPDRVGYFLGLVKEITKDMRKRLISGEPIAEVAKSVRDFQTETNAFRDNELAVFNTAWRNYEKDHLWEVTVKARNGQTYKKFIPMPGEDETWFQSAGEQQE